MWDGDALHLRHDPKLSALEPGARVARQGQLGEFLGLEIHLPRQRALFGDPRLELFDLGFLSARRRNLRANVIGRSSSAAPSTRPSPSTASAPHPNSN